MQQSRAISDFPKHPSDLAARSAAAVVVALFLFADTCTGQHDENSQWECRSTAGHEELRMSARATLQPETRASAITAIASRCGSSLFSLDALSRTLALVSSLVWLLFSSLSRLDAALLWSLFVALGFTNNAHR
jgi:ADP-ribosylglycohydrolase